MKNNIHPCGASIARINGRTLREALEITGATHSFGRFGPTEWIPVCPSCHGYALGMETTHPWPFLCADGVMRTGVDLDPNSKCFNSDDVNFGTFRFSMNALKSAIRLSEVGDQDGLSVKAKELGLAFLQAQDEHSALRFSETVCDWGRGHRVWGNLLRRNRDGLAGSLCDWLLEVREASDEDAIARGIAIDGLGVSFASKHLRMLMPDRFAVLDDVLHQGLGFALNIKGYGLFLQVLRQFQREHAPSQEIARIESAIFLLVRQQVRAE